MPAFVAAALLAGAVSAGVAAITGAAIGAAFLSAFGMSLILGGISSALIDRSLSPKQPDFSSTAISTSGRGRLITIRQPISYWQIIVGEARVGGAITYLEQVGSDLHLLITLGGHVCNQIGDIYFDDEIIPLDADGNATGRLAEFCRIQKSLGAESGQPFPDLVTESDGLWTNAHRQTGKTKIYVKLTANPDLFPNGVPNITAVVQGALINDHRTSPLTTAYSANAALWVSNYLTNTSYGLAADYDVEIDDADLTGAANVCDETVALAGSPSATEPRYEVNGAFLASAQPKEVLQRLLSAMAGYAISASSGWHIHAGAYESPTVTLNEGDLAGSPRVVPLISRRENCNGVRGTFTDPNSSWQPTDFPPNLGTVYLNEDNGERVWRDMDLSPFVTSGTQAQRLAKIELLRTRYGTTGTLPCKLTAFKAMTGRAVAITNIQLSWTSEPFEVNNSRFIVANDGTLGVELTVRNTAAAVYAWTTDDERPVSSAGSVGAARSIPDTAFFCGGNVLASGTACAYITEKYIYATDAVTYGTSLGLARELLAATGETTEGVFAAGSKSDATKQTYTDIYTYAGDTVDPGTVLGTARQELAAAGNSTRGIFSGGIDDGSPTGPIGVSDKYTYVTDTVVTATALLTARRLLTAAGNESIGVFAGGNTGSVSAVIERYTYSGDTVAAGTNLGTARDSLAASGDISRAIFGGGSTGSVTAVTDSYNYDADTVAAGTSLSYANKLEVSASNASFALFGGGHDGSAVMGLVLKYKFSDDTMNVGNSLGTARQELAATSSNPGWVAPPGFALFAGGLTAGGVYSQTTEKYRYNDGTVSTGGSLAATARHSSGAAGNSTRGVIAGGGVVSGVVAVSDKYTYATDIAVAGTNLGSARYGVAAAGDSTRGIFGGGDDGVAGTGQTTTDKYTYATDGVVAGAALVGARFWHAAAWNSTRGIFGAGYSSAAYLLTTSKYTYSGDSSAAGTDLGTARNALAAAGSGSLGIFAGGSTAGGGGTPSAVTDKYTYATDARVAGTNLGTARWWLGGASNSSVAVFGGGVSDGSTELTTTDTYTLTTATVANGTALGTARREMGTTSSTPGGF